MNTDRIYAEAIANEYAPKEASKVVALRKLDAKRGLQRRNLSGDGPSKRRRTAKEHPSRD